MDLKKKLIRKINSIDNQLVLEELVKIVDFESKNDIYVLNEYELNQIKLARQDYKEGKVLSNEEVNASIEKWLGK
jgi:hypothetical protein